MNKTKILIFVVVLSLTATLAYASGNPDNTLIKYCSALLTINLDHTSESSKVIYHLSQEPTFQKDFLEDQLDQIQKYIGYANSNISNITLNSIDEQKKEIDKYLKNIDEHLSQVQLDLQEVRNKLDKGENFIPIISDIYYQITKAENEDHREIKRILDLKDFDEPVLVVPER